MLKGIVLCRDNVADMKEKVAHQHARAMGVERRGAEADPELLNSEMIVEQQLRLKLVCIVQSVRLTHTARTWVIVKLPLLKWKQTC